MTKKGTLKQSGKVKKNMKKIKTSTRYGVQMGQKDPATADLEIRLKIAVMNRDSEMIADLEAELKALQEKPFMAIVFADIWFELEPAAAHSIDEFYEFHNIEHNGVMRAFGSFKTAAEAKAAALEWILKHEEGDEA